jgi:hypothetical protein
MNITAWRARQQDRDLVPDAPIELAEIPLAGRDPTEPGRMLLRYRLISGSPRRLEALRESRRAMIREQWTLGSEDGDPCLSEAVFSATEVLWEVPVGERTRCRETLAELVRRANRLADAGRDERRVSARTAPPYSHAREEAAG